MEDKELSDGQCNVLLLSEQFQAEVLDEIHHLFTTNGNVNSNHAITRTTTLGDRVVTTAIRHGEQISAYDPLVFQQQCSRYHSPSSETGINILRSKAGETKQESSRLS